MIVSTDENLALLFVQKDLRNWSVYQDGKLVHGVRTITIRADAEGFTTHEIEYVTGATNDKGAK